MAQLIVGFSRSAKRDIRRLQRTIEAIGDPGLVARVAGPALLAMGQPIARTMRQPNFGFRDRRGTARRRGKKDTQPPGRYKSLRRSIRVRPFPAKYPYPGGRRFKRGRAAIFVGGSGARQAHLVHEGHENARPFPFLRRAIMVSKGAAGAAFVASMRRNLPKEIQRQAQRHKARRRAGVKLGEQENFIINALAFSVSRRFFR